VAATDLFRIASKEILLTIAPSYHWIYSMPSNDSIREALNLLLNYLTLYGLNVLGAIATHVIAQPKE
jgi:hypothetical protein